MFQSYYDVEHDCVITSKSGEATVNCWCQEYDLSSPEFQKLFKEEKERKKFKNRLINWIKKKRGEK